MASTGPINSPPVRMKTTWGLNAPKTPSNQYAQRHILKNKSQTKIPMQRLMTLRRKSHSNDSSVSFTSWEACVLSLRTNLKSPQGRGRQCTKSTEIKRSKKILNLRQITTVILECGIVWATLICGVIQKLRTASPTIWPALCSTNWILSTSQKKDRSGHCSDTCHSHP